MVGMKGRISHFNEYQIPPFDAGGDDLYACGRCCVKIVYSTV